MSTEIKDVPFTQTFQGDVGRILTTEQKRSYKHHRTGFIVAMVFALIFLLLFTIISIMCGVWAAESAARQDPPSVQGQRIGWGTVTVATLSFIVLGSYLVYTGVLAKKAAKSVQGRVRLYAKQTPSGEFESL